jgi:hypothetical protein
MVPSAQTCSPLLVCRTTAVAVLAAPKLCASGNRDPSADKIEL